MKLIRDQNALAGLQTILSNCEKQVEERTIERVVNQVRRRLRTGGEMRLTAQIGEYEMEQIVLDIGFDVNVLTKQTWEAMGKPTLQWSPVQLRMANQVKLIPLGRFPRVPSDLDGVRFVAKFEVIEIVDENNPYLTLLGIEWDLNNNAIINLK